MTSLQDISFHFFCLTFIWLNVWIDFFQSFQCVWIIVIVYVFDIKFCDCPLLWFLVCVNFDVWLVLLSTVVHKSTESTTPRGRPVSTLRADSDHDLFEPKSLSFEPPFSYPINKKEKLHFTGHSILSNCASLFFFFCVCSFEQCPRVTKLRVLSQIVTKRNSLLMWRDEEFQLHFLQKWLHFQILNKPNNQRVP